MVVFTRSKRDLQASLVAWLCLCCFAFCHIWLSHQLAPSTHQPQNHVGQSLPCIYSCVVVWIGVCRLSVLLGSSIAGDTFAIKVLTKTELVKKNMVESVTNERNILAMVCEPSVEHVALYSLEHPMWQKITASKSQPPPTS